MAARIWERFVLGLRVDLMVAVAWWTVLWWVVMFLGLVILTEPGVEMRARSLRMRSMIMLSSARSFLEW